MLSYSLKVPPLKVLINFKEEKQSLHCGEASYHLNHGIIRNIINNRANQNDALLGKRQGEKQHHL